jgi:hypothetical protein
MDLANIALGKGKTCLARGPGRWHPETTINFWPVSFSDGASPVKLSLNLQYYIKLQYDK